MINLKSKIYVAGHKGLVGSAIIRKLKKKGYKNIIFRSKKQLDLKNQKKVYSFLKRNKPDFIFIAAAKVGGIYSNDKYRAEFIFDNLSIQANIIHSAYLCGIKNLIFLGSSCVYPRNCKQPIKESYLLTGELEKTNDAYAIAKIAGIKMCESYNIQYKTNYKCLMPTNTFGPNDNYDTLNSHFLPALIKKVHDLKLNNKKELILWGNGLAKREVIYVDDIADACIFFMKKNFLGTILNIGTGKDFSIKQYAKIILNKIIPKNKIKIKYDLSKPNGTPRKVLDVKLANKYGWKPKTKLDEAITKTYKNFLENNKIA
ncbi:GDP-L-fucose synthase [Candidatus Pelagibacter sp.]|nr:GDP-L-fucose synthase [Candidatus Pelagibacter sp.]